jgi:hypothetical protein
MTHHTFSLLAALVFSSLATAQTQSVEIRAPRAELHQVCPDARSELPDALAAAAQDVAAHGLVAVQFDIEGSRVLNVQAQGAQRKHVRAVQRAVRGLACSNGDVGRQRVAFNVRFVDPFDRSLRTATAQRVLLETPPLQ